MTTITEIKPAIARSISHNEIVLIEVKDPKQMMEVIENDENVTDLDYATENNGDARRVGHAPRRRLSTTYPQIQLTPTMTTETNTTDFDTVRNAILHATSRTERLKRSHALKQLSRIEASHAALVAQREALLTALEAIISSPFGKHGGMLVARAEAAVALSKGGAK